MPSTGTGPCALSGHVRQAEAEQERRSRVIVADGELEPSQTLARAAEVINGYPAAWHLRLRQTVMEVVASGTPPSCVPFPVGLLRFLERATPGEPPMQHQHPSGCTGGPQWPLRRRAQVGPL